MEELSRRKLLSLLGISATAGIGVYGAHHYTTNDDPVGGGGGGTTENVRHQSIRPVPGGSAISIEELTGYGTAAGGVRGPEGEYWIATNRHVVDPEYPDSDASDVLGTEVHQPNSDIDDEPVGEVVDVGDSKGSGATDWAVIEVHDEDYWTPRVLGLPVVGSAAQPEIGDRIVMSGARTGLIAGEITNTGISENWRGTLLESVVEYRVDERMDTAGNSGSWICTIDDETGNVQPIGLHTFARDDYRYAVPVGDLLDGANAELVGEGSLPEPQHSAAWVEGAVEDEKDGTVKVAVANIGAERVEERLIELRRDGEVVADESVSLDALEHAVVEMDAGGLPVTLDTGDIERSTEY